MSLSVGTLNLKFMQRAAAKSQQSAAPPLPRGIDTLEDSSSKWVLPRSSLARRREVKVESSDATGSGSGRKGLVVFESSYMPFLGTSMGEEEEEGEDGVERDGLSLSGIVSGRMAFGGFGQKKNQVNGEDDQDEDEEAEGDGEDAENDDRRTAEKGKSGEELGNVRRKDKGKDTKNTVKAESTKDRTFIRPAGFSPTSSPKAKSKSIDSKTTPNTKQSIASKLRETINASRSKISSSSAISSLPSTSTSSFKSESMSTPTEADLGSERGKGKKRANVEVEEKDMTKRVKLKPIFNVKASDSKSGMTPQLDLISNSSTTLESGEVKNEQTKESGRGKSGEGMSLDEKEKLNKASQKTMKRKLARERKREKNLGVS